MTFHPNLSVLQLQELDLSWCEELSDDSPGVHAVLNHCSQLRSLLLRHLLVSADSLSSLADNCTQLTTLNMASIPSLCDDLLLPIAGRLHQLQVLDVSWNAGMLLCIGRHLCGD